MPSTTSQALRNWLLWPALILLILFVAYLAVCFGWIQLRERVDPHAAAPVSGRFLDLRGTELYVQESGPATGDPVLLVGGTGAWSGT